MALTIEWLKEERINSIGGLQRIYDMGHGWTLSAIDSPMTYPFAPFAWEFAVIGPDNVLEYGTELTSDVEVFFTDEEAEAFLRRARAYFDEKGVGLPFTTREQEKKKREEWMGSVRKFIREDSESR